MIDSSQYDTRFGNNIPARLHPHLQLNHTMCEARHNKDLKTYSRKLRLEFGYVLIDQGQVQSLQRGIRNNYDDDHCIRPPHSTDMVCPDRRRCLQTWRHSVDDCMEIQRSYLALGKCSVTAFPRMDPCVYHVVASNIPLPEWQCRPITVNFTQ